MDLNDAEAQELLLRALPVDEKESHLSKRKRKILFFSLSLW